MSSTTERSGASRARSAALKQARLDEILGAAGTLFFERGFEGATMQDIAERVGLLAGSLYYYIETKEDLLYELALRVARESLEFIEEDSELRNADAAARFSAFIDRWMQRVRDAQPRAAYAAVERHRRALSPERFAEVENERRKVRKYLGEILTQGAAEGLFVPAPLSVAINNILQVLWSTALWFDPDGDRSFDEITDWYKEFLLRGMGVPVQKVDEIARTRATSAAAP